MSLGKVVIIIVRFRQYEKKQKKNNHLKANSHNFALFLHTHTKIIIQLYHITYTSYYFIILLLLLQFLNDDNYLLCSLSFSAIVITFVSDFSFTWTGCCGVFLLYKMSLAVNQYLFNYNMLLSCVRE
jgi:hypothetical protein